MNFDGIARWYQTMEYLGLGRSLERRREEFLPDLVAASGLKRVLLLGDGDGRFLAALLATNPTIDVDTVDGSAEMLRHARQRTQRFHDSHPSGARVHFHHSDALSWLPAEDRPYDAVITHFFLDCLAESQIESLLLRLEPFLASRTTWIVSEFRQPDHGLGAWRAKLWIGGLYWLFGWATGLKVRRLPDHRAGLENHGFRLEKEVIANFGLLVSERWQRGSKGFYV